MSKKRQLTPRQQEYADAIIAAGLAGKDEVENAFSQRTEESQAIITVWGAILSQKRKEERQEQLRRLRTQEQCAYPGCPNVIKVKRTWEGDPGTPRPTRTLTLTMQMEGWHWDRLSKVENTQTITYQLWGCCAEHQEGIFHLEFTLTPTLVAPVERPIQYPMTEEEQWRVYELARKRARDLVEQASHDANLPHIRRTIAHVAQKEVAALIDASNPERLTDDVEKFRTLYVNEFVEGYLEALRTRKHSHSIFNTPRR